MTDQDQKIKINPDDSSEQVDSTIKPELLGVELSEELKKTGADFIEEVASTDKETDFEAIKTESKPVEKDFKLETDSTDESLPTVPKKEFSMPEQSKQIEDIVEGYLSNPSIVNSGH